MSDFEYFDWRSKSTERQKIVKNIKFRFEMYVDKYLCDNRMILHDFYKEKYIEEMHSAR